MHVLFFTCLCTWPQACSYRCIYPCLYTRHFYACANMPTPVMHRTVQTSIRRCMAVTIGGSCRGQRKDSIDGAARTCRRRRHDGARRRVRPRRRPRVPPGDTDVARNTNNRSEGHGYIGHDYKGHNYKGHNYKGHTCICHIS